MKIIVRKVSHENYIASIEDRPEIRGVGRTMAEAVGYVILNESQRFNITIEIEH